MPLPGGPGHEKRQREAWLKIPRRSRAAIRKMHKEWGHLHKTVLRKMLKAAKAPQEHLDAVDAHLCKDCDVDRPKAQTSRVGPPNPYEFNHTIGVDVFDLHDYDGNVLCCPRVNGEPGGSYYVHNSGCDWKCKRHLSRVEHGGVVGCCGSKPDAANWTVIGSELLLYVV